uniref:Uncharacterized protein n=1 Tax=Timema tahoe TaxID=61484 RepID=A0A7R9ITX4_9NEOP|nr:unnamed protein product [Timema tahoe]
MSILQAMAAARDSFQDVINGWSKQEKQNIFRSTIPNKEIRVKTKMTLFSITVRKELNFQFSRLYVDYSQL